MSSVIDVSHLGHATIDETASVSVTDASSGSRSRHLRDVSFQIATRD